MRVRIADNGRSFVAIMEHKNLQLKHTFSRMGIFQSEDPKAAFANQLQFLINEWRDRVGPVSTEFEKQIMNEVFLREASRDRSGDDDGDIDSDETELPHLPH